MSITTDKYIGPQVPLVRNKAFGDYVMINDYAQEIKQNLKNIVMTGKGERMMDKDFGLGIREYLFENYNSDKFMDLESELIRQCEKYLPVVEILSASVDMESINNNAAFVKIEYSIPDLSISDVLEMTFVK